jgi:hypothetical protein
VPNKPVDLELGELAQELGIGGGKAEETFLEAAIDRRTYSEPDPVNKKFLS